MTPLLMRDRRDRSEPPLFVPSSRKTRHREAIDCGFPELLEPLGPISCSGGAPSVELLQVWFAHDDAPASSSHSYPFASSSRARSLLPDFTILPPEST